MYSGLQKRNWPQKRNDSESGISRVLAGGFLTLWKQDKFRQAVGVPWVAGEIGGFQLREKRRGKADGGLDIEAVVQRGKGAEVIG